MDIQSLLDTFIPYDRLEGRYTMIRNQAIKDQKNIDYFGSYNWGYIPGFLTKICPCAFVCRRLIIMAHKPNNLWLIF